MSIPGSGIDESRMGIYRSEEMCLAQLFLQSDAAYQCVAELGELGLVQFRDLNPDVSSFQRKYVSEVRRCDEMERKLRFLEREIKKEEIMMLDTGENPDAPLPREMIDLEATFEKLENELREVNRNEETLKKNFSELTELKHILRKTQTFFEEVEHERWRFIERGRHSSTSSQPDEQPLITTADEDEQIQSRGISLSMLRLRMKIYFCRRNRQRLLTMTVYVTSLQLQTKPNFSDINFVAGVIQRERLPAFEKLLWRACRGNVFLKTSDIDDILNDTVTGEPVNKTVFIIFFQGDQLKIKVKKICEGFRATLYPCPDTPQERREMSIGVITRIEDLKTVLGQTQDHKHRVLVAASKNLRMWLTKVRKIKSIYHTLNLFNIDVTQKCLIAEVWCPVAELERIKMALRRGTEESGSQVPSILNKMDTHEAPPTYNKTNKFTKGFQNIVDAYGIATYREINPAPYTMISFPFLFAVMFGDMGHGMIMLAAALFFILKEKQLEAARIKDEIFQTFFGGRYVIFLMGAFSIYTGFLYNDIFAKSLAIFDSSWANPFTNLDKLDQEQILTLPPSSSYLNSPYPIGLDPVWNLAETNKLTFMNSMKMKMSVLIGIAQMTFGLILSFYNHRYFHSDLDIKFMFIPQVLFLSSIFIYLCLQIIVKWLAFTSEPGTIFGYHYPGATCAPSLLIGLINMFMNKKREHGFYVDNDPEKAMFSDCFQSFWYPGQSFFETIFLLIAICTVPVMLGAKPYILWKEEKERLASGHRQLHVVEVILLLVALLTVPVMLCVKPFLEWRRHKKIQQYTRIRQQQSVRADMNGDEAEVVHAGEETQTNHAPKQGGGGGHGHGDGPFNLGDVIVYQAIHTIEFVLGCVSHTASYLRLWALSLAHAQLSEVLWNMVFRQAFFTDGYIAPVATYVLFFVFGFLSVGILVLMEGLSAFLHALRLHWVEFQSKFYGGNGYAFAPFSFEKILEEEKQLEDQL